LADGTPMAPTAFVRITTTGQGATWTPEPVDATWRDLAELDLSDPIACQVFARRRGDVAEKLSQGRPERHRLNQIGQRIPMAPAVPGVVTTSQWEPLALALQQAALAWEPADDGGGVSHFNKTRRREAQLFTKHPGAVAALKVARVDSDQDGSLVDQAHQLPAFLILSASLAIERGLPMKRCLVCGSWFSIRRPARAPQFCSASCRATHHHNPQHPGTRQELPHGIDPQKSNRKRDAALASDLARTSARGRDDAKDTQLRHAKRGARARPAGGAGGRKARHRRPRKT
jgi:hypothetical protein